MPSPLLDPDARDQRASDASARDNDLFMAFREPLHDLLADAAVELPAADPKVRALALEAALFGAVQVPAFLLEPDVIAELVLRMDSNSSRVRMVVADFLWEHGEPSHKRFAAVGAESALEWAGSLTRGYDTDRGNKRLLCRAAAALEIAIRLAVSSNHRRGIRDIAQWIVNHVVTAAGSGDVHRALILERAITSMARRLTSEQRQTLLSSLQALHRPALTYISPVSPPDFAGRLLQLRRELALAGGDVDSGYEIDREHAALVAEHAVDRGDPLVEEMFLREAIHLAERGQETHEVLNAYRSRRRNALERGMARMPTARSTITVSANLAGQVQAERDRMVALALPAFFEALASHGRITRTTLEAFCRQARVQAPLSTGTAGLMIVSPGETVHTRATDGELLLRTGLQMVQINAGLHLLPAWRARMARGDVTAERLAELLAASGNVEAGNLSLIQIGLRHALNEDAVSALHILVPQLEDVLRRILGREGHDPGRRNPSDQAVTEEITLGSILQQLEGHRILTSDDALLFTLALDEPRGLNLRNRIGHGLVRIRDCSQEALVTVLQCYAIVAQLRVGASSADVAKGQSNDECG
jgi:hypothetical protein